MKTTHTPEPWRFNQEEMKIKGTGDFWGRDVIANFSPKMDYSRGMGTQFANAARIVACVNAMKGIDDPEQWVAMAKTHMDASEYQAAQNRRLKEERDELLAALKELVELKDLKIRLETAVPKRNRDLSSFHYCKMSMNTEYDKRNPIAWQTAKELIEKIESGQ